jgi:hypothetical protein
MIQTVIPVRRLLSSRPGQPCRRCRSKKHPSWQTIAACRWRVVRWPILGCPDADGPCYAVVSECGGPPAVSLWASRQEAEAALRHIAALGCGPGCQPDRHALFVFTDGTAERG